MLKWWNMTVIVYIEFRASCCSGTMRGTEEQQLYFKPVLPSSGWSQYCFPSVGQWQTIPLHWVHSGFNALSVLRKVDTVCKLCVVVWVCECVYACGCPSSLYSNVISNASSCSERVLLSSSPCHTCTQSWQWHKNYSSFIQTCRTLDMLFEWKCIIKLCHYWHEWITTNIN